MSAPTTELPSGLVTFLFTDIEGSTRLLHRLGDRFAEMLDTHRSLIRAACSAHGGTVISESGDSEFAAFWLARDALDAAAEAQSDLAGTEWPDDVPLRVRMGLHTGMAWPHEGNYVALSVHQAARVMAAAHGGQTLVSDLTVEALGEFDRSRLTLLGRYRLRDFDEPVGLYQLGHACDIDAFPAIRALPADRHNIVRRPTQTVGRDGVIDELTELLQPGSLVTLTGPGGVGKSRIAADVGTKTAPRWSDGVWMADLAAVSDEELVVPTIAEAVGAPRNAERDRWADLIEHLRSRQAVIVLDNCEHLLGACRRVIGSLLEKTPTVAVLATSREPVRVGGELIRPIDPLDVPGAGASLAETLSSSAVRLFSDRASAVHPDFRIDAGNAEIVADICRELDGLPLFIELASAYTDVQTLGDILAGLRDSVARLRARDPAVPERHRTVDGVMDWSFRLLDDDQRSVFVRLSVFGSSFTLDTAVATTTDRDESDVRETIWSLVDRSLVIADLTANDTRYRLLDIVRSYARSRLDEAGATAAVALTLARHFLHRLGPWLPASVGWVGEVADEVDNLRALISSIPSEQQEIAQQLAYTIGRYHDSTYAFAEGIEELTRYVDGLRKATPTRSSMLNMLAYLHLRTGEVDVAERLIEQASMLRNERGAPDWDDVGVDRTRGEIARRKGQLTEAIAIASTTLDRDLSDRGRSRMLNLLGTTAGALGDLDTSYRAFLEELELNQALGYDEYVAAAQGNLAETALRQGKLAAAATHQRACLELASAQGTEPMLAFSMLVAARMAASDQDWATAMRLQSRAEVLLDEIGLVLYEDDREQLKELATTASAQLGEPAFARASEAGGAMSTPDAVRLADMVLASAALEDDL